jgi:hypothetical protein
MWMQVDISSRYERRVQRQYTGNGVLLCQRGFSMSEPVKDAFIIIAIIILVVVFIYLIMMSGALEPYDDESENE